MVSLVLFLGDQTWPQKLPLKDGCSLPEIILHNIKQSGPHNPHYNAYRILVPLNTTITQFGQNIATSNDRSQSLSAFNHNKRNEEARQDFDLTTKRRSVRRIHFQGMA
eukprot:CAMPEP_0114302342 /NCGR_PEP_ID=MMETSP0059-20121206/14605_1 /TAXON_ID=36894 /ORGANISM="Pyramimonas parkeae, Strain CCMP726" /LENGTH=107 /DNA_ID=CAMNT_0001425173 /DNA_START=649 /DNA_END=972 /DNA_ORIENTATION=-